MAEWSVVAKTVTQVQLASELDGLLDKATGAERILASPTENDTREVPAPPVQPADTAALERDVYLFREGATVSRFDWGDKKWLTDDQLEPLWIVRLFAPHFELFARRIDYARQACWQLRIAAAQGPDGPPAGAKALLSLGTEQILLLGQSTGDEAADGRTRFECKPNRYRRADLCYPGKWPKGQTLVLVAERFQPPQDGTIVRVPKHPRRDNTERFQPPQDGTIVCWQTLAAAACGSPK